MWNTAGGSELIEPIMHPAEVRWAGFSSDGQRLVTLLSDVTGRVWEVRRGAALPTRLKHKSAVMAAEFTRDGNQVMTVAQDTTGGTSVQVWTAATGTLVVDPKRYDSAESLPEFSPDATRLLTRSDKGAQLWDVASGNKIGPLLAHDDFLMSAHFNSDGKQVVTASHDKTAKIWSAENGTLIGQPLVHEDKLMLALFSPDSKRIVTSTEGKKIRIWDVSTGASIAEWEYVTYINAAQFSPDGRRLVTWTMDDVTAHVWEVENGQASSSSLRHSAQVNAAEFSPDGKKIVTASDDRTARVWDAQTGKPLTDALEHGGEVTSAGFSPNGRQIVTVSRDNTVRIWDAESGKPIAEPFQCRDVASARFSPDGARLLLASQQSGAVLWDLVPAEKVAPKWLLSLAEITAGQRLDDNGVFQTLTSDPSQIRKEIESQLATVPKDGAWSTWGHWWLSDRGTRTISPFSRTKISEYIEMLIQDNTPASLDEAEEFAFGNREAYERIMRVRQNNGSEPGPTKRP
jgi:WD40 repeat protein